MMWIGMMMLFGPISVLLSFFPIFGSLSRSLIAGVTLLVAIVVTIITIIISMLLHNIFALLTVVLLTIVIVYVIISQKKKNESLPPQPIQQPAYVTNQNQLPQTPSTTANPISTSTSQQNTPDKNSQI